MIWCMTASLRRTGVPGPDGQAAGTADNGRSLAGASRADRRDKMQHLPAGSTGIFRSERQKNGTTARWAAVEIGTRDEAQIAPLVPAH
jgi:hypothetical protein